MREASKYKLAFNKRSLMHVRLLTELSDLKHITAAWMELYRAPGRTPFQNPDLHLIWWQHLGLREGWAPLVVIGLENSQLVAVASFAVRRSGLLRVLEWAGTQGRLTLYTTVHCRLKPDRLTSHCATVHSQHF